MATLTIETKYNIGDKVYRLIGLPQDKQYREFYITGFGDIVNSKPTYTMSTIKDQTDVSYRPSHYKESHIYATEEEAKSAAVIRHKEHLASCIKNTEDNIRVAKHNLAHHRCEEMIELEGDIALFTKELARFKKRLEED